MKKIVPIAIAVILAQILFYVSFGFQKADYHVDEYYTYQLANSSIGPWWSHRINEWQSTDEMLEQMTVRAPQACFQFKDIIEKQKSDLHPFLYSMIINTACSMVRMHDLSPWPGIAVNIFFSVGIFVISIFISAQFTHSRTAAIIIASMVAFSYGVTNMVMLIRMYTMQMFVALCITAFHCYFWNRKMDLKAAVALLLISVTGALTQYHFLIYLFFSALVFCVHLIIQKRYHEVGLYVGFEILAGILTLLIFPVILKQLFTQNPSTTMKNDPGFFARLKEYHLIITRDLFGDSGIIIIVSLAFLTGAVIYKMYFHSKLKKNKLTFENVSMLVGMVIPVGCFLLFIIKTVPGYTSRYVALTYPIMLIAVGVIFYWLLFYLLKAKILCHIILTIALIIITVAPYAKGQVTNLFLDRVSVLQKAQENSEKDVVLITGYNWLIPYNYCELEKYGEYLWTTGIDIKSSEVQALLPKDDFMLYLSNWSDDQNTLTEEQARHILAQKYDDLEMDYAWDTRFATVYMCRVSD